MKKLKNFLGIVEWMDLLGSRLGSILGVIILRGLRLSVFASAIRIWRKFDLKFFQYILLFFATSIVEILSMFIGMGVTFIICFIFETIKNSFKRIFSKFKNLFKKSKTEKKCINITWEDRYEAPYTIYEAKCEGVDLRILKCESHPFYSVYGKRYADKGYIEISSSKGENLKQAKSIAKKLCDICLGYIPPKS